MSEENLTLVHDFCNVHGDPVQVLENDSGDCFVNLRDVLRTGFKVYKGETFVPSMVDKKQIIKEFEMHMLTEAHNYLLAHQKKNVDEVKVLQTIENCKKKLLGNDFDFNAQSGSGGSHRNSNNPINRQPRENQYKNDNFAPGKSDQDFRPKAYRNSSAVNAFSSSVSVDSQESGLMRLLAGENVPEIDLEIGEVCRFKVCHIVPNRENICFAQLQSAIPSFEEMMLDIFKIESELEAVTNPQEGQLLLGLFEGAWCRAKVISVNPTLIHFLDYGNRARTQDLKVLPDNFRKIPGFAIRLKIQQFPVGKLTEELPITVLIKKKHEDRTYLVVVADEDDTQTNVVSVQTRPDSSNKNYEDEFNEDKNKAFFGPLKPLINLKDGAKVRLVAMEDGIMFVKTKECYEKIKEITSYIQQLDTITLPTVQTNQLVLASRDDMPGLHRAIITDKMSNLTVSVKYLDFPGTDGVSIKSLRNVDGYLARQPSNLLQLPALDVIQNLGLEARNLLDGMIQQKERVTVINHNGGFDLQLNTGELLSDVLLNCGRNGA